MNAKDSQAVDQDLAKLHALLATAGNDFSRTFRVVLKEQDWLVEAMPASIRHPRPDRAPAGMATFTLAAGLAPMLPTTTLDDLVPPPPSLVASSPVQHEVQGEDDWSRLAPVEIIGGPTRPPIAAKQLPPPVMPPASDNLGTPPERPEHRNIGMGRIQPGKVASPAALPPAVSAAPIDLPPLPGLPAKARGPRKGHFGHVALGPDVPPALRPMGPDMPLELRPLGPDMPSGLIVAARTRPEATAASFPETPRRTIDKPAVQAQAQAPRWHTIRPGETLIQLARRYYEGKGRHWLGLFAFNRNRIRSADKVFPGDRIQIPAYDEVAALTATRQAEGRKPGRLAALGKDLARRRTRLS
ncbi:MAG: LysM peptidoglycan-binding domain-containing protein [Candidatus Sericytochromatia bacterium]|nr:LysM peptidoglycan-binding domain-containing protein [Candidatus Tanganyikabacteria bacterium]